MTRALFAALLTLALLVLGPACSSEDSAPPAIEPSATAAPAATATTTPASAAATLQPDGDRILGYVKKLADEIGARPAGSAKEDEAVAFIAGHLRALGYDVTIQDFGVTSEASRSASLSISAPSTQSPPALPLGRSASGSVQGSIVPAGGGAPNEFPASVAGNIALIERGGLQFQQKVANAAAAGARAAIIYNNEPGSFLGSLTEGAIPAISISREDGQALLRDAQAGTLRGSISVGGLDGPIGHNVIAKPPGGACDTVTGGHFDSVPQAPGASDNATGTAATLELASLISQNGGMGAHCFVLWGAEENGLIGSRAFVNSLAPAERQRLKLVLNLDMVGVGEQAWWLIGTPRLQQQAQAVASQLGINAVPSSLFGASSDHATFIAEGIPSLMIHRWEDPLLHTPQDVSTRVQPQLLEEAARIGLALLHAMEAG